MPRAQNPAFAHACHFLCASSHCPLIRYEHSITGEVAEGHPAAKMLFRVLSGLKQRATKHRRANNADGWVQFANVGYESCYFCSLKRGGSVGSVGSVGSTQSAEAGSALHVKQSGFPQGLESRAGPWPPRRLEMSAQLIFNAVRCVSRSVVASPRRAVAPS